MKIAFLLWSPAISGGTNVIFEHAKRLKKQGVEVTIITENSVDDSDLDWHAEAKSLIWKTYSEIEKDEFDVVIATWWRTAFYLSKVRSQKYVYFVQSIESKFYPEEEVPLRQLVDMTYYLPVHFVTEATWIKEYLLTHFNQTAYLVKNGINKRIFNNEGKIKKPLDSNKLRVLVEGPLGVSFKNVEKTIELCKQSDADEIWLLSSSKLEAYEGVERVFSQVPIEETAEIYRSCDVLVKLSKVEGMFGPPLEMYHCGGTSITYNVTGYDEYIVNNGNGIVLNMDDELGVVSAINMLKSDRNKLVGLKQKAMQTASDWWDWDSSATEFHNVMKQIISSPARDKAQLSVLCDVAWQHYDYAEKARLQIQAYKKEFTLSKYIDLLPVSLRRKIFNFVRTFLK